MRRLTISMVSVLLVAVAVAMPAGARDARKRVVRIDITGAPAGGNPSGGAGKFVLKAVGLTDSGSESYAFANGGGTLTLTGKHGQLFLRLKAHDTGLEVDSEGLDLWMGTWKIVSGTGSYEKAHGVGGYTGIIGPSYKVAFHLEGFLT